MGRDGRWTRQAINFGVTPDGGRLLSGPTMTTSDSLLDACFHHGVDLATSPTRQRQQCTVAETHVDLLRRYLRDAHHGGVLENCSRGAPTTLQDENALVRESEATDATLVPDGSFALVRPRECAVVKDQWVRHEPSGWATDPVASLARGSARQSCR